MPSMTNYIAAIQQRLVEDYGFPTTEYPVVPDGRYPVNVDGRIDRVRVVAGMIECGRYGAIEIRAIHPPDAFRSGEWATLLDICRKDGQAVYMVRFPDVQVDPFGDELPDVGFWPLDHRIAVYEFREPS